MKSQGMKDSEDEILKAVEKLYPTITEAELRQAVQNFRRYVEIVYEIRRNETALPTPAIDNAEPAISIKERSNSLKS